MGTWPQSWFRFILACTGVVFCAQSIRVAHAHPTGNERRVAVVTFGPGDHPFFKFGHNAILIENAQGQGEVFNFGTFDFGSPALIPKFLMGRFMYWLSRSERDMTLAQYQESDRTIEIQELELTAAQALSLHEALHENARPQNREYLYDYFWDNCSTRVRDALDRALAGHLKANSAGGAALTFRQHALRLTADVPWEYTALHFGLGSPTDVPGNRWLDAFIPAQLRDLLRDVKVVTPAGEVSLVRGQTTLYTSTMPPPPAKPPHREHWFLLAGLAAGGLFLALLWLGRRWAVLRASGAALMGAVGLVTGLLGTILIFLWVFTNHRAAWANENILQTAPFLVGLLPVSVGVALGRGRMVRVAFRLARAALICSLLGLVLKVLPFFRQDNWAFIAFFVPFWAALFLGLRGLLAHSSGTIAAADPGVATITSNIPGTSAKI